MRVLLANLTVTVSPDYAVVVLQNTISIHPPLMQYNSAYLVVADDAGLVKEVSHFTESGISFLFNFGYLSLRVIDCLVHESADFFQLIDSQWRELVFIDAQVGKAFFQAIRKNIITKGFLFLLNKKSDEC